VEVDFGKMDIRNAAIDSFLRSFVFSALLSLRRVKTRCFYQVVRHPIYLSALVLCLGYILKNPSICNAALLIVVAVLYDKRAKYEEDILSHDRSYVDYLQQVRYRFVPGVY
jgi:protein-S-isoprenylcysteine O-methyltransferase Ste14